MNWVPKKPNEWVPDVVDNSHMLNITDLGIKNKVNDADFLGCVYDMISIRGPT